jgi:DNA-binding LacI/PurR family transcriptional regulator
MIEEPGCPVPGCLWTWKAPSPVVAVDAEHGDIRAAIVRDYEAAGRAVTEHVMDHAMGTVGDDQAR